jgi:glycosyltransferase involved in cell wall biosynthesis
MRILQLHNRYQIAGGEDGVVRAEHELLQTQGHTIERLEVSNDKIVGLWEQAITATQAIYSTAAKRDVEATIIKFQPDIVHVHNFFPLLSPSVYAACRSHHVPVVQTLHNYRLACPKAMLFRDQKICEVCIGKPFAFPSIVHGCYRGSRSQSAVVAAMLSWHHWRGTWQNQVDAYIALTTFQADKLIEAGLPASKMVVKPNFVFAPPPDPRPRQDYVLFVGRLSEEKGVADLIEAYCRHPQLLPLKIAGDGPLQDALVEKVKKAGLETTITFLGRQASATVRQLMQQAQALVFPSIWYEGFPLTIAEAFSCGLPVIVPHLGSMAEIVSDGVTGLHFRPGDTADLAAKIDWIQAHPDAVQHMAKQAHLAYTANYTPDRNYEQLMAIYRQVSDRAN